MSTSIEESPGDLLTYRERELLLTVNAVFINSIICLLGTVANIINITVFCKQGFAYTINISLMGLSISDLCVLVTELLCNIFLNPLLRHADISFASGEIYYLSSGVPSLVFSRISGWITVFITAERCVGIASPLKVRNIITSKRIVAINSMIYMSNLLAITPEYLNYKHDWKFFPKFNKTLYGLTFNTSFKNVNLISYIFNSLMGFSSFAAVSLFTAILVTKLIQKSAWRRKATIANAHSESISGRDKKTMKMIVLIASVTIASYMPGAVIAMIMYFNIDFRMLGLYNDTFCAIWSFPFMFQAINSSVNIFLYYRMSTKYRQTFQEMFWKYRDHDMEAGRKPQVEGAAFRE